MEEMDTGMPDCGVAAGRSEHTVECSRIWSGGFDAAAPAAGHTRLTQLQHLRALPLPEAIRPRSLHALGRFELCR
jgi:hypothetical protein